MSKINNLLKKEHTLDYKIAKAMNQGKNWDLLQIKKQKIHDEIDNLEIEGFKNEK